MASYCLSEITGSWITIIIFQEIIVSSFYNKLSLIHKAYTLLPSCLKNVNIYPVLYWVLISTAIKCFCLCLITILHYLYNVFLYFPKKRTAFYFII